MPILVLTSERKVVPRALRPHCTVKFLEQAGVKPTFIRLADQGIKGNGHMMMVEKNNLEIAAVIDGWLDRTLGGKE